jgi:hypothetical protein
VTLPAFISNFTDRLGANLGTRAQPHISIEGDRLTLVDGNGDTEPVLTRIEKGQAKGEEQVGDPCLECVIVDGGDTHSQVFYEGVYDRNNPSPPACWSDNGIGPSIECNNPQAVSCKPDPSGQHGCKWAVWGSGRAAPGSKTVTPACQKVQKLALMIPGDDIQFRLNVPPASLVQLANYNAKFKGHPFSMVDVVTRVSIRDKTLHFTGVRNINDAEKAQRAEVWAAKKTDALVGRGDKPRSAVSNFPVTGTGVSTSGQMLSAPIASLPASAPAETQPDPLFAGNAGGEQTTPPPSPAPADTSAPSAPTRRRGRPPKEAAPVAETPATNGAAQAPFPHGMAAAPAPNADLEASLKSVFG